MINKIIPLLAVAMMGNGVMAFWRMPCSRSGLARIDPIISPGEIASHVHTIHGSSGKLAPSPHIPFCTLLPRRIARSEGGISPFTRRQCVWISAHLETWIKSPHAHKFTGFGPSSGFSDLRAGDCTSCEVAEDKSVYWTPPPYFRNSATGEFSEVNQVGGMLA